MMVASVSNFSDDGGDDGDDDDDGDDAVLSVHLLLWLLPGPCFAWNLVQPGRCRRSSRSQHAGHGHAGLRRGGSAVSQFVGAGAEVNWLEMQVGA